jgi:ATP citrate (pro-S)-lyase
MTDTIELFNNTTTAIFYNQHPKPIQRMLDFDYICKRTIPSIAAIINPNGSGMHKAFFGSNEIMIPVYQSLQDASKSHQNAQVLINFASERSAYDVTKEAIENIDSIKTIHIMAEGVPENKTRELIRLAKLHNKFIIGPATVGAVKPGAFRTGEAGGSNENIIDSKLYRPGSVGVVTISGGMSGEIYNLVARNADGAYEGIAVGGDKYPASSLVENLLRIHDNPEVKMLVCLGEIGGKEEYAIVDALKEGRITKPIVIWVSGTIATQFKTEVQFGHAGAKSGNLEESAQAKNKALKAAGAYVPESFDTFGDEIKKVFEKYVQSAKDYIAPLNSEYNEVPEDFEIAFKQKKIRKPASILSTISDDRGEEATYNKKLISEYAQSTIGNVINALWFKGDLSKTGEEFLELAIKLSADHGPAVSTAHNSIVTARAGNNVIMSLISGLTTIGPRHGGAIDGAALWILDAVSRNLNGREVINEHKQKGELIMGIGHRIKSAQNPDTRVTILKKFAKENLKATKYLDMALEVEAETLKKKNTLILNVDGAIGAIFLDILADAKYSKTQLKEIIDIGALNAIFVLARSIGIIGHALDQKRLQEPLYRHEWSDILYS